MWDGIVTGYDDFPKCYYVARQETPNTTYHVPENWILKKGRIEQVKKENYKDAWDRAMRGI